MMCHSRLNSSVAASRHRRGAYSLIEMLIVLAVMVGTISLSWPAVRNSLAKSRLRHAARQVQTTLNKLRSQAIRSGTPQMLRYQEQGNQYQVTTAGQPQRRDATDATHPLPRSTTETHRRADRFQRIELPNGIRFRSASHARERDLETVLNGQSIAQPITAQTRAVAAGPLVAETQQWSPPIVCYPNGRTSDAHIVLAGQNGFVIRVTLRGLTGIVTSTGPNRGRLQRIEPHAGPPNSRLHRAADGTTPADSLRARSDAL
ncbi:MAG: hypothetical protein ABGZ17_22725 [Planctomycetaceae bacterium]